MIEIYPIEQNANLSGSVGLKVLTICFPEVEVRVFVYGCANGRMQALELMDKIGPPCHLIIGR